MSVGIVLVTHGDTGRSLVAEAEFVLGALGEEIHAVPFNHSEEQDRAVNAVQEALERADGGDGVLVLADLMGSSPCNRVSGLLEEYDAVMVTGVNLPMLLTVLNYRDRPLGMLARKAVESGRRGVMIFQ